MELLDEFDAHAYPHPCAWWGPIPHALIPDCEIWGSETGQRKSGRPCCPRPHSWHPGHLLWKSSCRDRTSLKRMPSCLASCPASSWGPCSPTAALSMSSSITFGSIESYGRLILPEKLGSSFTDFSFALRTKLGSVCLWCYDLLGGHKLPAPVPCLLYLGTNTLLEGCPKPSQQPPAGVHFLTSQPQWGLYPGSQGWCPHGSP